MKTKFALVIICLLNLIATPAFSGAITFGREKLKGTTKSQGGDHQLGSNFSVELSSRFASGIIDDNFEFAFNREGVLSMSKLGAAPQVEVLIDGVPVEALVEVSGSLSVDPKVIDPESNTIIISKTWDNKDQTLGKWFEQVKAGKVDRRTITISFSNDADKEKSQIHIHEAWPTAYRLAGFNSQSSAHATESLAIKVEAYKLQFGK